MAEATREKGLAVTESDQALTLSREVSGRLTSILEEIKQLPNGSLLIGENDDFLRVLEMDSIDAVELTLQLDSQFGLDFGQDPDDLDALARFGSLVDLILARGNVGARPR